MSNSKPLSRKEELVLQDADGELLIYDLRSNKAFCLNETSAHVWRACDGRRTVSELGKQIGSDDVVWLALHDLRKAKLIDDDIPMPPKFEGMTRRQVVKHVGLSTMLALPVIAGLVAPAAAQVGTCTVNSPGCTANGMMCVSPLDCCSCICGNNEICNA